VRAIVFSRPGEFSLTEVPDPVPAPREAVVRVEAVGICGTDLHVLDGEFAPTVFPIVPGHETSGVVVSVGEEVTNVAPGDPVSLDPSFYCGECSFCMVGRGNLCENWDGAGVARTDGSTAELVRSPAKNLHRLSSSVDLALAALIEPLSCAIHAYDLLPRWIGAHYLIYGAGTMGLIMAQLAPRAGAASVSVVDPNPRRQQAAREVGIEVGSMAVLHSYARAVEMFAAGALKAKPMVSHAFALADYGDVIEAFRAGTGRKVQIRPQAGESVELL
jgi:2-desacetyl-2-hydroxyethyl bacteriochlorophyllide A dehydrogenase